MFLSLDDDRLSHLASLFITTFMDTLFVEPISVEQQTTSDGVILGLLKYKVTVELSENDTALSVHTIAQAAFTTNTNWEIAKVTVLNATIETYDTETITPTLSRKTITCDNKGGEGSLYTEAKMTTGASLIVFPDIPSQTHI